MDNCLEWRIGDNSLVESTCLGNISNDCEIKFALWQAGMGLLDLVDFFLRSNRSHYRVAVLKQKIQDVGCNKATSTLIITLADKFISPLQNNKPVRSTRVIVISNVVMNKF